MRRPLPTSLSLMDRVGARAAPILSAMLGLLLCGQVQAQEDDCLVLLHNNEGE